MATDTDINEVKAQLERLDREVKHIRAEYDVEETGPVSDEEHEHLRQTIQDLDDETLVFTLLGLLAEMKDAPGWGRTMTARVSARVAFGEVCVRWIPPDVFAPAFREIFGDLDDPESQECRDCGRPFPYDPEADRCPACVAEAAGDNA